MSRKKVQRINKSIRILGLTVPVKMRANLHDEHGRPIFGYYDPEKRIIVLNSDQTDESLRRTFYHEIGHAFLDRIGIRVSLSQEIQEVIVEGLSNLLEENFFSQI